MQNQSYKDQITAMGLSKVNLLGLSGEINYLPKLLMENEKLENFVPGRYMDRNGALILTETRAIFLCKTLFNTVVEDFTYKRISSVQHHLGLLFGEIILFASGNRQVITNIPKDRAAQAADYIRTKIAQN